jgi:hypothetical protein
MEGEIHLRRDQAIEGMDKTFVDMAAAAAVISTGPDSIGFVPGGPERVEGDKPERLTVFERRRIADGEGFKNKRLLFRNVPGVPGPKAAATTSSRKV